MSDLLNKASLVMVPSGYKEDTVYSVIPTDGSGDLSFTRASNGTRVNSAGLVEVVPWNLLQQSETIGVSPWSNSNLTITANSVIAPNGTTTADVLTETTATTTQFRTQQTTPQSTNIYTLSVYVKNITGTRQAYIDLGPVTGFFNFATETIYSASAIGSFEKLANGWYRIALTTANAITPSTIYMGLGQSNSETYTGNGTSAIAFWGAQLNIGSTAKPYFPTTDRLNVPRLTYQNGGGGCPSLLLEKQSTNLILQSEAFDSANWALFTTGSGAVNRIANAATSPDGTTNADEIRLTRSTLTSDALLYQQQNVGNSTYSRTIYLKAARSQDVGKKIDIWSYDGSSVLNPISPTLTADWQRIDAGTATGALVEILSFGYLSSNTFPTTSGTDVRFYAWGAQGEASSYPTSYIPTTSSSATRVADACFKTGISSLFGTNQGTFFIDLLYLNSVTPDYLFDVTDSSNTNRFLMYDSNGSGLYYFYDSGYSQITTYQFTKGQRYKIAVKYNSSGTIWYVNGVLSATGTVSFAHQMAQIYLGVRYSFSDQAQIQVNETIVFPTALSGTELISLTTI